jgi:DNA-binding transcriptional regulator YiaG
MEETLCGKCNKPKKPDVISHKSSCCLIGQPIAFEKDCDCGTLLNFCNCGRPNEFKEEYITKVDEYLESRQDEEVQVVKQSSEKYEMFDNKLKVKLPTIEGFARYINVNKTSLYEWEKQNEMFSNALDKIRIEQQERLINAGLSGDYNSTIAKLILSSNHGMRERGDVTSDGKAIKGNGIVFSNFKDEE